MSGTWEEVRFPTSAGDGTVRGKVHRPAGAPGAALVIAHGRSVTMDLPLFRRLAAAAAEAGLWALRFNFRYADEKGRASRDLSREADDLLGAIRFARRSAADVPVFPIGASMGARVAAIVSSDPDVTGIVALGYPLHPMRRPEVRNPPEWPRIAKPVLFVQGDHDEFCSLERLGEELPRLTVPHELAIVPRADHGFRAVGERRDTFPEVWDAVHRWAVRNVGTPK